MPEAAVVPDHSLLYHYTSGEGLFGIIEQDNIRATHVSCLNDYTEFSHAFQEKFVEPLLTSFQQELPTVLCTPEALKVIKGVLSEQNHKALLNIIESSKLTNDAFVCSFTAGTTTDSAADLNPGDRLSQWRGYSHSPQGFSLGFDRKLLLEIAVLNNTYAKADLFECVYKDNQKVALFQKMGKDAAERFTQLTVENAPIDERLFTSRKDASEQYKKVESYFLSAYSSEVGSGFR
jgi:hypothetical protein